MTSATRFLQTVLLISLASYGFTEELFKIPDFIKICHRNDPDMKTCLQNAFEVVRPYLAKGLPELFLPSMEPLNIPKVTLDDGPTLQAEFHDLNITGLTNFRLENLDIDLDNSKTVIDLVFPVLGLDSNYNVTGKILVLKLNGQGKSGGDIQNVQVRATLTGNKVANNGKQYIHFDKIDLELTIEKGRLQFYDLIKDNDELTAAANAIINKNINDVISSLPIVKKTIESVVFDILQKLFRYYSVEELFPN